MNSKIAQTAYPIHDLLKTRWSPRVFSSQPVETDTLLSLFEAARWAPSSANSQPWSFIVVRPQEPDSFQKLLSALGERNRLWAQHAPVLVLAIAKTEREPGKPNGWATYDLGQSVAHLSIQATARGLFVHQMGGFNQQQAAAAFELPAGYQPMTVIAIGYPGNPDDLPEDLRERELAPRMRKPLEEVVFDGAWEKALKEPVQTL